MRFIIALVLVSFLIPARSFAGESGEEGSLGGLSDGGVDAAGAADDVLEPGEDEPSGEAEVDDGTAPHAPRREPVGEAEEDERAPAGEIVSVIFGGIVTAEELAPMASGLEAVLVPRLEELGRLDILRTWDLGRLLDNQAQRFLAGCTDDCGDMIELLAALDAPLLLVGELHEVADIYLLTLTLLATDTARVLARTSTNQRSERKLVRWAREGAWDLLSQVDLGREELGPHGLGIPRLHLSLKAGNSLAFIRGALDGRLHGGRLNVELSYYARSSVLVFFEVGAGVGRARDPGSESVLDLDIVPVGFGVKRLWTHRKMRLWAGGMLGAGFLGMFLGDSNDLATALSMTAVAGLDHRIGRSWTVLLEGSISLTDALLRDKAIDLQVPVYASVTVGVSRLF